ncbi:hypothetical protein ABZ319_33185 [Nocardia sp. NPDC005978]|uniref:hypothetical protein n=1 Tax=Nocardia sp. NPDC005978 TaxID=3156725 RepID=UPI0033B2BD08
MDLPPEIRAALSIPVLVPESAEEPDPVDTDSAAMVFVDCVSYEDWKREREWSILAPPWI